MIEIHDNFLGANVNSTYSLSAGEFDTSAKMGKALAKTTYPICVSEFGNVETKGRGNGGDYSEDLKNAIEKLVSRSGRDGSNYDVPFPSCCSVIINGNPKLSNRDTVIKRFDNIKLSKEDRHLKDDPRTKQFEKFRDDNHGIPTILGDWTMNYIWDNREELILSGKYDSRQIGDLVIKKFYEFAGVEFPKWLDKWIIDLSLEELEINESYVVRGILREHTHKSLQQGRSAHLIESGEDGYYKTVEMRVGICLDNELWSFVKKGVSGNYSIDTSILELFKDRLPEMTLIKLGQLMKVTHKHTNKGSRLRCTRAEIQNFIVGEETEALDFEDGEKGPV
jgi:hypothetical protein